tara:strand:- start:1178 stop:2167 length:990 start_codon:yes stop_codon:yes gene_type:complete
MNKFLEEFIKNSNNLKNIYSAGPSSLLLENIVSLQPCFGRNDKIYDEAESFVLDYLSKLSSHENVIRLQGSATLALEIAILNFCRGKILVIETGYYSNRLTKMALMHASETKANIETIAYEKLDTLKNNNYDWIIFCYTETSIGFKVDIESIKDLAVSTRAQLLCDATASIGIENKNNLPDIICYSSCKGLFGLTGSSFIAFRDQEIFEPKNSYYLSLNMHKNKGVTGPYHTILSLYGVLNNYEKYLNRLNAWHTYFLEVFKDNIVYDIFSQPKLCTLLNKEIKYLKKNPVPYQPRINIKGSVICHIGQIHNELNKIDSNLIREHFSIT